MYKKKKKQVPLPPAPTGEAHSPTALLTEGPGAIPAAAGPRETHGPP